MRSVRREESKIIAEGRGIDARSECLSAEKRGFEGCRHSSRKAYAEGTPGERVVLQLVKSTGW
jgi:hypothetical protein